MARVTILAGDGGGGGATFYTGMEEQKSLGAPKSS